MLHIHYCSQSAPVQCFPCNRAILQYKNVPTDFPVLDGGIQVTFSDIVVFEFVGKTIRCAATGLLTQNLHIDDKYGNIQTSLPFHNADASERREIDTEQPDGNSVCSEPWVDTSQYPSDRR